MRRRELEPHSWVAEKNPGATDVGVGDSTLGGQDGGTERLGAILREAREQCLVHEGLGLGVGEAGGGPDGDSSAGG